jgi:hypothetical protein
LCGRCLHNCSVRLSRSVRRASCCFFTDDCDASSSSTSSSANTRTRMPDRCLYLKGSRVCENAASARIGQSTRADGLLVSGRLPREPPEDQGRHHCTRKRRQNEADPDGSHVWQVALRPIWRATQCVGKGYKEQQAKGHQCDEEDRGSNRDSDGYRGGFHRVRKVNSAMDFEETGMKASM